MPINDMIGASLVQGGLSLGGSLLNSLGVSSANKQNKELLQAQNNFNYNMWKENNEYNSPVSQIARLREAGINPNFAGQVQNTSQATSATSTPNMLAQQYDFQGVGQSVANMIQAKSLDQKDKELDIRNKEVEGKLDEMKANIDKMRADTEKSGAETRKTKSETIAQDITNKYAEEQQKADLAEKNSRILLNAINGDKAVAEKEYIQEQKKWYSLLTSAQIANLRSGAFLSASQANSINEMLPYEMQKAGLTAQQIGATVAGIILDNKDKSVNYQRNLFEWNIQRNTGVKIGNGGNLGPLFDHVATTIFTVENAIDDMIKKE